MIFVKDTVHVYLVKLSYAPPRRGIPGSFKFFLWNCLCLMLKNVKLAKNTNFHFAQKIRLVENTISLKFHPRTKWIPPLYPEVGGRRFEKTGALVYSEHTMFWFHCTHQPCVHFSVVNKDMVWRLDLMSLLYVFVRVYIAVEIAGKIAIANKPLGHFNPQAVATYL